MNNYFSHDSNARDDEKILAMRIDLGWEAYGLYWALIEMLRDASDYMLKANYKVLAFSLHTTPELIRSIICDYGLFCFTDDQGSFFSASLTKRMEEKEVLSKKRRASAGNRWGKSAASDANAEQNDAIAMQMHNNSDANAEQMQAQNKVKESKEYTSPRTRESASVPNAEEKEGFFVTFFFRNIENPAQEVERFVAHNAQHGWKLNNTTEKRRKAAREWVPESKKERVSARFLEAWKALYAQLVVPEPGIALDMLDPNSRMTVSDGFVVIHARKSVQEYILKHNPQEIQWLVKGNKVRFSWP